MRLEPEGARFDWLGTRTAFFLGLAAKLALIVFAIPEIRASWFAPFVGSFVSSPSIDPWSSFLAGGGAAEAFPYGPIMLLSLLPGALVGSLLSLVAGLSAQITTAICLALCVLVADLLLWGVLSRMTGQRRLVTTFYWLSPITNYILYWHGQLDIVPMLILMVALYYLEQRRFSLSGAALGLAAAAKLSILLALPFILIYLVRNARLRGFAVSWLIAFGATALLVQGPFLFSPGFRTMVLGTPQAQKTLDLAINVAGHEVFILPVAYLLALYLAWRVRRISFSLLLSLLGGGFFLVLLLTPAAPGWFLWFVPFLVLTQITGGTTGRVLGSLFSVVFVVFNLLVADGARLWLFGIDLIGPFSAYLPAAARGAESFALTALAGLGIILAVRLVREGVQRNDYYRLSRSPLLIGIAGDSGAGKDTLAQGLRNLFGPSSVAHLSGDDYHLWNRAQPMWQVVTHLNPRANDLGRFIDDAMKLADGKSISVRHYNHKNGRYGQPSTVKSRDVLIVSGLHALYFASLRERLDVKVFLDPDEDLRRWFKIKRDAKERGHSPENVIKSIEARVPDSKRFIRPQAANADIIFSIASSEVGDSARHQLAVTIRHCLYLDDIVRCLIGICGLRVDYTLQGDGTTVELLVEGEVQAEDMAQCAQHSLQHLDELLSVDPKFAGGTLGLMQFVVLAHSAQALRSRLV